MARTGSGKSVDNFHRRLHLKCYSKFALLELTFLGLCLLGQEVNGRVMVYRRDTNQIIEEYNDMPSAFGANIPSNGLKVFAVPAIPIPNITQFFGSNNFACQRIQSPQRSDYPKNAKFVAIIQRGGNCTFEKKVRNAQAAFFNAAVVYNNDGDDLEQMSADNSTGIRIPSVFVGQSAGESLLAFYTDEVIIVINDELPFNINTQLILPFAILIGICFLVMIFYMVFKCIREERRLRRTLLPKKLLKKLPIIKYTKKMNLAYDTCVICLDDFVEGDKIRILVCGHPYHSNCIDPWLTENRRICPICKRKVYIKRETRSTRARQFSFDSVTDTDDDTTPLLHQPANNTSSNVTNNSSNNGNSATRHGTFTQSNNNAATAGLSAATSANEMHSSDDENALLTNVAQSGRRNPFDRSASQTQPSQQSEPDSRSLWSYPILRLFRRREPLSIAAPPFNENVRNDVENQLQTAAIRQNPPIMVSNNILNPNLSGSFKEDAPNMNLGHEGDGDNSSSEDANLIPHHNIYEPVDNAVPPQRQSSENIDHNIYEPVDNAVPPQRHPSENIDVGNAATAAEQNHFAADSMFIQTPTQGGIGVVALPNANNTNEELLATTTIQPNQQQPRNSSAGGHRRYRGGFLF